MAYDRYSKFTMTNYENDYQLMLVCGNYNYTLNSGASTKELPNGTILSEIVVKREFDKSMPFGTQIADTMDFDIDTYELRREGYNDVLSWIIKNGLDLNLDSIYNGTADKEFCQNLFNFDSMPNIWILRRGANIEYIGIQVANPSNKITLTKTTSKRSIKTIGLHKWVMEKVKAQFWSKYFYDLDGFERKFDTLDLSGFDYKPMKIVDLYKNINGKNRHSYNYCRDGNHSYIYGKIENMMYLMSEGFRRLAKAIVRESCGSSYTDSIVIPNPLLSFNYYKNPTTANIQGDLLNISDVLINIGYSRKSNIPSSPSDYLHTYPLITDYKNLWNFANLFYGSYGQRLIFDYSNCGFKMKPIVENAGSALELTANSFADSGIEIDVLADLYSSIQIRTKQQHSKDVSNFRSDISASDTNTKAVGELIANNVNNCVSIGESFAPDIKRFWNYYDSRDYLNFPNYKLFYYDADLATNNDFKPGHIKVANIVAYNTDGAEIEGANYTIDWTQANTVDSFNDFALQTQNSSIAGTMTTLYNKFLYNKKIFILNCELPMPTINSSMFGKNFTCDFGTIFEQATGEENVSKSFILSNAELNYSKNEAKCAFFIRGDIYANY